MSGSGFTPDTEEGVIITLDGEDISENRGFNVALVMKRMNGTYAVTLGPNHEWQEQFDATTNEAVGLDPNGQEMYRLPPDRAVFPFERMPQVPEYDAIADVPDPDPDGPYSTEPADPRGIVRFTATAATNEAAIPAQGLYSYSLDQAGWVRIDAP